MVLSVFSLMTKGCLALGKLNLNCSFFASQIFSPFCDSGIPLWFPGLQTLKADIALSIKRIKLKTHCEVVKNITTLVPY